MLGLGVGAYLTQCRALSTPLTDLTLPHPFSPPHFCSLSLSLSLPLFRRFTALSHVFHLASKLYSGGCAAQERVWAKLTERGFPVGQHRGSFDEKSSLQNTHK